MLKPLIKKPNEPAFHVDLTRSRNPVPIPVPGDAQRPRACALVHSLPIRLTPKPRVQPHNGAEFACTGANMSTFRPAIVEHTPLSGWKWPDVKSLGVNRIGMVRSTPIRLLNTTSILGSLPARPARVAPGERLVTG